MTKFNDVGNASVFGAGSVKGDGLIVTDKGMIPVNELRDKNNINSFDINRCEFLYRELSNVESKGNVKTIKLATAQGFEIECDENNPIVVLNAEGNLEYKCMKDLTLDDKVALSRGSNMWGKDNTISEDLAYYIGLIIGDGYLASGNGSIVFSKTDPYLRNKYIELVHTLFPEYNLTLKVWEKSKGNRTTMDVRFWSSKLKSKLEIEYGLKMTKSEFKEIPQLIMMSPKEVVIRCIQGLFDTDGTVDKNKGTIEYCTKSPIMIRQVQTILLNLGIVSKVLVRSPKNYPDNDYYYLYIGGSNAKLFKELIGFRYALGKIGKLNERYSGEREINDNTHLFYFQSNRLHRMKKKMLGKSYYKGKTGKLYNQDNGKYIVFKDYLSGKRNLTKQSIFKILGIIDFENEDTKYLNFLSGNIYFDKIKTLCNSENTVYSLTVSTTNAFVINGFIIGI